MMATGAGPVTVGSGWLPGTAARCGRPVSAGARARDRRRCRRHDGGRASPRRRLRTRRVQVEEVGPDSPSRRPRTRTTRASAEPRPPRSAGSVPRADARPATRHERNGRAAGRRWRTSIGAVESGGDPTLRRAGGSRRGRWWQGMLRDRRQKRGERVTRGRRRRPSWRRGAVEARSWAGPWPVDGRRGAVNAGRDVVAERSRRTELVDPALDDVRCSRSRQPASSRRDVTTRRSVMVDISSAAGRGERHVTRRSGQADTGGRAPGRRRGQGGRVTLRDIPRPCARAETSGAVFRRRSSPALGHRGAATIVAPVALAARSDHLQPDHPLRALARHRRRAPAPPPAARRRPAPRVGRVGDTAGGRGPTPRGRRRARLSR